MQTSGVTTETVIGVSPVAQIVTPSTPVATSFGIFPMWDASSSRGATSEKVTTVEKPAQLVVLIDDVWVVPVLVSADTAQVNALEDDGIR